MSLEARFGEKRDKTAGRIGATGPGTGATEDWALEEALKEFRLSVCAWSEAAYSRPRIAAAVVRRASWRLAAGWALGVALVVGGVSGTAYERHHRQEMARIAAVRAAEQQRLVRERQAREEEEDLLAKVDSDVSREVPNAMEPLAQLMAEDGRE
jgi:hypothetical protein